MDEVKDLAYKTRLVTVPFSLIRFARENSAQSGLTGKIALYSNALAAEALRLGVYAAAIQEMYQMTH